jgi:hypothetical protein
MPELDALTGAGHPYGVFAGHISPADGVETDLASGALAGMTLPSMDRQIL